MEKPIPSRAHLELYPSWKRSSVCSLLKKEIRKKEKSYLILYEKRVFLSKTR